MRISSPLRYPGGKAVLSGLLAQIKNLNGFGAYSIAEPYAGGAGASLTLLFLEEASEIFINDADPAIFDFWWSVLNRYTSFSTMIVEKRASMTEWKRQRAIYRDDAKMSRLKRGFSAFYLNRCNRSGIIMNGGPIGGIRQTGTWKINARYNKRELVERCRKIAEFRDRIHLSNVDGIQFIKGSDPSSTFYFIDPPYFKKGPTLYLNSLTDEYHEKLADQLKLMRDAAWALTYDDCPEIRKMYRGWAQIRPFSLRYAASESRNGNEILVTPKSMKLPLTQTSAAIEW
jgi:DNA adenine methylase